MSFFPENSAVKVQPGSDLERAISQAASVSEIQALLHQAAVSQHLIEPDPIDRDGKDYFSYRPVETPQPRGYAKAISVDGKKIIVESDTEAGLVQKELEMFRTTFAAAATTEQTRDNQGRFTSQQTQQTAEQSQAAAADVAEQTRIVKHLELDRRFRLGEITSADYIRQSGALDQYLAESGVDMAALQEVSATRFNQSWAQAGEAFRNGEGRDWIGGTANRDLLGLKIVELGLVNAPDKVAALVQAYRALQEEGSLVENETEEYRRRIAEAQTPDELRAAAGYQDPSTSSGIVGR